MELQPDIKLQRLGQEDYPVYSQATFNWKTAYWFSRKFWQLSEDTILFEASSSYPAFYIANWLLHFRRRRPQILLMVLEAPYLEGINRQGKLIEKLRWRLFLHSGDRFIVNSHFLKNELTRLGIKQNRITVIPPVGQELPTPDNVQRNKGSWQIICPCNIYHKKGQEILIKALALMGDKQVSVKLVGLVKDQGYYQQLVKLVEQNGLSEQVNFCGFKEGVSLAQEYAKANILVFPSLFEPYGMVVQEAMRFGLPIIASDTGGIPEQVRDGIEALLVPPGDAQALAQAIRKIIDNPNLRETLIKNAQEKLKTFPSWKTVCEDSCNVIREMGQEPIAYLVDAFPANVSTFVLSEMEGLEKQGIKLVIFSWRKENATVPHGLSKKWQSEAVIAGCPLFLKVVLANIYFLFRTPAKYITAFSRHKDYGGKKQFLGALYLARVAQKKRIRHIHANFAWNAQGALLISKFTGISYSSTMHHADILYVPPKNMAEIINSSKFTSMVSDYNRNYVLNRWPGVNDEKLKLVRLGVDFDRFSPPALRQNNKKKLCLLTVARMDSIKQIPFHLEVCSKLRDRGYSFSWRFVGNGKERTRVERLIKERDLEGWVDLAGAVPYEKMADEYRRADIFILLSKSEGIPVALMEAMATGLPVVASRITGIPELVEDKINGFLISEGDLDGAVKLISQLIESPLFRGKMGQCGKEKVLKEYGQKQNAIRMKRLFYD